MYALVVDASIQATTGRLPSGAKRLDTGQWITPYNGQWTQAEHEACGWYAVVEVAQPADTPTDTFDRSVTLQAGIPTVSWTQRPKTQDELTRAITEANRATIDASLTAAIADLDTLIAAAAVPAVAVVPTIPAGAALTTTQLTTALRAHAAWANTAVTAQRDASQATRAGAQQLALTLKRTLRLVRGDFSGTN